MLIQTDFQYIMACLQTAVMAEQAGNTELKDLINSEALRHLKTESNTPANPKLVQFNRE